MAAGWIGKAREVLVQWDWIHQLWDVEQALWLQPILAA